MNLGLIWNNVVAYSLQIGLLVGLAAFVPALTRMRTPRARLLYWHLLLAACLLLPAVRPWKREIAGGSVQVTTTVLTTLPAETTHRGLPVTEIALILLAAGFVIRVAWLAAGFWHLRQYRRRSTPLVPPSSWGVEARLCLSPSVVSPVTFGFRRPVVLLPANFPDLPEATREAILCHEILHVRRGDWLFTVGEELLRAILWFHPAIWWLLGEIQLAREQAVDSEVVAMTRARDEYVDALLAIAGARAQVDLAPAPLFLRKRHLKQRVVSLFGDARISRARLISALCAGLVLLAAQCWLSASAFPLIAAPEPPAPIAGAPPAAAAPVAHKATPAATPAPAAVQPVPQARSTPPTPSNRQLAQALRTLPLRGNTAVSELRLPAAVPVPAEEQPPAPERIRVGGNVQQTKLISQPRPLYPPLAKQARIEGSVHLQAVIAKNGTIADLKVLSGHPLLIQSALEAVRQWVYAPTLLNGNPVEVVTQIDVNFTLSQ